MRAPSIYDVVGKPWRLGAVGPDAFDCLGLVRWFKPELNPELDHYPETPEEVAAAVDSLSDIWYGDAHGDIVLISSGEVDGWDHLGVVVGDMVLHIPILGHVEAFNLRALKRINHLRVSLHGA